MEVAKASDVKAAQSMLSVPRRRLTEQALAAQQTQIQSGNYDTIAFSGRAPRTFANRSELDQYLRENFPAYGSGLVSISRQYLRDCMEDGGKLAELEETLNAIPGMLEDAKQNLPKNSRLISCTFSIDEDGNLETEMATSSVGFNAAKRAAELSGAMTAADVGMVLAKLQKDLSDVKSGGCDEDTIAQVKNMIRKAEEKMRSLQNTANVG